MHFAPIGPFLALRKYGDNDAEMGSEANPAAFIDGLLDLCAEFRRVLAPHGSIAVELGDTYSGSGGAGGDYNNDGLRAGQPRFRQGYDRRDGRVTMQQADYEAPLPLPTRGRGWPLAKSLAGIPEAFMLSLAYGWNVLDRQSVDRPRWRVRNVIVWARPNPPVGALGDKVRPATSYITVACVSGSRYFDLDAVRTELKKPDAYYVRENENYASTNNKKGTMGPYDASQSAGAPPLDWWEDDDPTGRATLVLPTQPYPGAHYATWPPTLAKRLIEMMCPIRVCTVCGEPSRRVVENEPSPHEESTRAVMRANNRQGPPPGPRTNRSVETTGWTDCGCPGDHWRKGHVLDPFSGSATTLSVAHGCGREATGIELYAGNAALSADRMGMFLEVS